MKPIYYLSLLLVTVFFACSKKETPHHTQPPTNSTDTSDADTVVTDTFITYLILRGNNYCEGNSYPIYLQSSLRFKAIFDSSCIYTNADPINQADINKLYGFSDCQTLHHANSARFGWNWMNGKLHIHAYCYVDSVRQYKELGVVDLNKEIDCSIDLLPGKYVFTLNGKKDTMERHCSDTTAYGVKLFPYFGGDEPAPQDVRIRIKEVK